MTILSDVPAAAVPQLASRPVSQADEAFVIETAETAAGVIVREENGYRFFAADKDFQSLDGSVFKSPKAAQRAAELLEQAAARDHAERRRAALAGYFPELPWS